MDVVLMVQLVPILVRGAAMTMELTCLAVVLGTALGLPIALARLSRHPLLRAPASMYTWWMRGTPLLMQLFLIYYGLPQVGITLDPFPAAAAGMTLNAAAYIAEILRGGILSIDRGQMEAARSLGMSYLQAMRWVILPQAVPRLIPPMGNEVIARLKDSSLVSTIAMVDLMRAAQQMIATTFRPLEIFFAAGVFYLVMTTAFTIVFGSWEKRIAERGERGKSREPVMARLRRGLAGLASVRGLW
ncbi:MAG: amino acid ABC transporter permease [Firmicutes bacterium]|jgi:polar amino acid transport system permease protein|nr:amino acid ABC transporter permease [Bacillota bacterium]MDH7494522.1 amino acid ABC transporter permease [Bacillota bacterium]